MEVLVVILAYFIGNISPATIIAKSKGIDIKNAGSGNAGTTNVLRVVGKKAALFTLIIDVGKGVVATLMGKYIYSFIPVNMTITKLIASGSDVQLNSQTLAMVCGLAAFLGHVYPVTMKFKGGKGVATALGVLLAINWHLALICMGSAIVVTLLSRMMSLGSITAAVVCIPVAYYLEPSILIFIIIMAAILIYKHKGNIKRIIGGEENKLF